MSGPTAGLGIIQRLFDIFERSGSRSYLGEQVSMAEHMLQAAALAEAEGAAPALVAAALLHDVGHFTVDMPEIFQSAGIDRRHEEAGARLLAPHFGPAVTEPIRLHVAAKRYLTGTDAAYRAALTSASVATLAMQGGALTGAEAAAFSSEPYAEAALRVRRWDDAGKVAGRRVPGLGYHRGLLESLCARP